MIAQVSDREPIDLSQRNFGFMLRDADYKDMTVHDLNAKFSWAEVRLIIQSVRNIEAIVGNDYVGSRIPADKRQEKMQTLLSWMMPTGWPGHGTLPGAGHPTVNGLYREAFLLNAISIILWHRNRYKPILHPVVGYKIVEGLRFHESYEPTEEDIKKGWWR